LRKKRSRNKGKPEVVRAMKVERGETGGGEASFGETGSCFLLIKGLDRGGDKAKMKREEASKKCLARILTQA